SGTLTLGVKYMSKKLENTRVEKYTHRKKRNKKRILLYILIPLLIVLLGGGAFAAHIYSTAKQAAGNSYEDVGRNDEISDLRDAQVNPVEDNVSVLIMGVDDSEEREFGGKSRTDALDRKSVVEGKSVGVRRRRI